MAQPQPLTGEITMWRRMAMVRITDRDSCIVEVSKGNAMISARYAEPAVGSISSALTHDLVSVLVDTVP